MKTMLTGLPMYAYWPGRVFVYVGELRCVRARMSVRGMCVYSVCCGCVWCVYVVCAWCGVCVVCVCCVSVLCVCSVCGVCVCVWCVCV